MGPSTFKSTVIITELELSNWREVGIHRQVSKIVENIHTKTIAELQTIFFDPNRDFQKQIQIYQYRKNQSNALVKCFGVIEQQETTSNICGLSHTIKVLTQRIPFRLSQISQLPFSESLYALGESLRGYKDCYSKLGAFYIDEQMIGANLNGEIKVWVNQNFAENHPAIEKPLLQTSGSQDHQEYLENSTLIHNSQAGMVINIIKIIQNKNQFNRFPPQFSERIYKHSHSFEQAYEFIGNFVVQNNIFVPNSLKTSINNKVYSYPIIYYPTSVVNSDKQTSIVNQISQRVENCQPTIQSNKLSDLVLTQQGPKYSILTPNQNQIQASTFRFVSPQTPSNLFQNQTNFSPNER